MRLALRFIIGVVLLLALVGATLFLLRKPIVAAAAERLMARAGLEHPAVEVGAVSLSQFVFREINAGPDRSAPAVALRGVAVGYDWRSLLFDRKVESLAIEEGAAVVAVLENGAIDIAGWSPNPEAKPGAPPVDALVVKRLEAIARTSNGDARFQMSGDFSVADGGGFEIRLAANKAGFAGATFADATGEARLGFGGDGSITLDGALKGDLATPLGAAKGVVADIDAALSSWRGFFGDGPQGLSGEATIALQSSTIEAGATPALAPIAAGAEPIREIGVEGTLKAAFGDGGYAVRVADGPLKLTADRGDYLLLSGGAAPLFESRGGVRRATLEGEFAGLYAEGKASLAAVSENSGPWRIDANALLGDFKVSTVAIDGIDAAFRGEYSAPRLSGEADVAAHFVSADIGRLKVTDMPAAGRLSLSLDLSAGALTATPAEDRCLDIMRARLQLADQDARLSQATLCPAAAPLITVSWKDPNRTRVEGALLARAAHYEIGRTIFDGAPPRIDFALEYEPPIETTRIAGSIAGGRLLLNKALELSNSQGVFEAGIVKAAMSAKASLSAMRIAQNAELEMVAPVAVTGEATLDDDVARFDFNVKTPQGAALGKGEGRHQMSSGRGEAVFDSGLLKFAYGFQPDRLLPALRGVISNASGTTEGRARFVWAPDTLDSSATINLDNLSFGGPGVAVTRTEGVAGKIVFSELAPVATAGEQTLSIRKIDLDALKLENGVMRFALPGDETLKIIEAEFPWFGGTIGAYDSLMPIGGGKSETTLQIDDVNLSQLLGYINVEGLSGEGVIEGVLPITFEGGRARINNGILSSKGPGVIRYEGKAATAASQNEQSALAFQILRELRFDKLAATIDGRLDGTLDFNILFEGRSDIPVKTGKKTQAVDSPVKYRITIKAPLLSLIEQAILSTDVRLQIEQAKRGQKAEDEAQ